MTHEVFICHASRDKTVAEAVCATLESKHIRCWIAPRDVLPGAIWGESVADALDGSHIVVLVLSSSSCNSPQVIREVERAASNDTPIVPLRIDDVALSRAIGFFVSSRHWLDAQTPPLTKHLQRLADTVQQLLTQERVPQKSIEMPEAKEKSAVSVEGAVEAAKSVQQVLHCPECGIEFGYEYPGYDNCPNCNEPFDDMTFDMLEPDHFRYLQDGYKCYQPVDGQMDIFVELSPYYTYAQFCSPCAPGAVYLMNHIESHDPVSKDENLSNKGYCLGHDWFESRTAPYPVYDIKTRKRIVILKVNN